MYGLDYVQISHFLALGHEQTMSVCDVSSQDVFFYYTVKLGTGI